MRGNLPIGPGWNRQLNSDLAERTEGGEDALVRGLGLSLDAPKFRKRVTNLPGNAESLPPPSD